MFVKSSLGLLTAAWTAAAAPSAVVRKDVLVIGGGASGAHAAVRLRDDYGLSVALIEKQDILGGHVNSFTDPDTGAFYNYGVQTWVNTGNATGFLERFGVPYGPPGRVPTTFRYIDYDTATELPNYMPPTSAAQTAALRKFLELEEKYEAMLYPGFWDFPDPENIPEELLMPFGEFAVKHGIEDAAPIIWRVGAMGVGDMTKELTLYVMQNFPAALTRNFVGLTNSFVPSSGRSQDLYDAIDQHLGDDVYRSSTVVDAKRNKCGVRAIVLNHKTGEKTEIAARALVVAIEPVPENLDPFHLDEVERSVFDRFIYTKVWAGILSNPALPVGYSLQNMDPRAAPANYLAYKDLPFSVRFDYMGANKYFRIMIQGDGDMTDAGAREMLQADFDRLIAGGILETPDNSTLEYVAWEPHGPMHARVKAPELEAGFIQDLYALHGRRSTWYTGGAFSMNYQTSLWEYNDILLPKLVASLEKSE